MICPEFVWWLNKGQLSLGVSMCALDEQLSHICGLQMLFHWLWPTLEAGCSRVQNVGNIQCHAISTSECMIQKVQFKIKDKLHCGITRCKWLALHVWKPQRLRDCHILYILLLIVSCLSCIGLPCIRYQFLQILWWILCIYLSSWFYWSCHLFALNA